MDPRFEELLRDRRKLGMLGAAVVMLIVAGVLILRATGGETPPSSAQRAQSDKLVEDLKAANAQTEPASPEEPPPQPGSGRKAVTGG